MNKYRQLLEQRPELPRQVILERAPGDYFTKISQEGLHWLKAALSTPEVEGRVSREIASELNKNSTEYDRAIDRNYNESHVGGASLHHNLDGSHTFEGAMQRLREEFPNDLDWQLRLRMLEHFARDFTTPSGINPWLSPPEFNATKVYLMQDLGISASLANDLLNFNAAELASGLVGAGSVLFHQKKNKEFTGLGRQLGRLSATYFFAGNLIGLMLASAVFMRLVIKEPSKTPALAGSALLGTGEVLLAACFVPLPLSASLMLGAAACVFGRITIGGGCDLALEMEQVLTRQFPRYRSYLSTL